MYNSIFGFKEKFTILSKVTGYCINKRNIVKNKVFLISFVSFFIFVSFNFFLPYKYKVKKIVIDAGHGGKNWGTTGKISKEKTIALAISEKLGKIIKEKIEDVEIIFTRSDDTFIGLDERADIANKNSADLFVSIHCNSSGRSRATDVHGTETWVMGVNKLASNLEVAKRENSVILMEDNYAEKYEGYDPNSPASNILFSLYQNAHVENSLKLADNIESQFKHHIGKNSRGVKQGPFLVLHKSYMPSVLVEVGFLTNPQEEKELNDDLKQTYIASAIYRAIRDYKNDVESTNE